MYMYIYVDIYMYMYIYIYISNGILSLEARRDARKETMRDGWSCTDHVRYDLPFVWGMGQRFADHFEPHGGAVKEFLD